MILYLLNFLYLNSFTRGIFKWILRIITGKCELLRIVYSKEPDLLKILNIESSLRLSKSRKLNHVHISDNLDDKKLVQDIITEKSINIQYHSRFVVPMELYLSQISGYHKLTREVEHLRKIPYSSENSEHEDLLMKLWNKLNPGVKLPSRKTVLWEDIGFQGKDPATDFRGMGMLGLNCLVYLSLCHTETARYLLSHSHHPKYGYFFAIVGINITSVAYQFLMRGKLRSHFYAAVKKKPLMSDFYRIFIHFYYEFDKYWMSKQPDSIMEFERIRTEFEQIMLNLLESNNVPLQFTFI
ncbi:hypothetical protein HELRODRAFT_68857 [Helobdella robusta]|uniref:ELMO domain-containing protein n=1 Tax=Helobdella robusta TaxID=6412 RepID=T1FZK5_HELRO|nr:hypothetical protein HELRODRAFT_68857 [Helobdella robusta]ESN94269.1 hypothetical protein HELRODRAFT_68857 [Helobdella robusta]